LLRSDKHHVNISDNFFNQYYSQELIISGLKCSPTFQLVDFCKFYTSLVMSILSRLKFPTKNVSISTAASSKEMTQPVELPDFSVRSSKTLQSRIQDAVQR